MYQRVTTMLVESSESTAKHDMQAYKMQGWLSGINELLHISFKSLTVQTVFTEATEMQAIS